MIHGKRGAKNFYNFIPVLCSSSSALLQEAEFHTEMDNYPINFHRFTYLYYSQAALGASRIQRQQTELSETSCTLYKMLVL